MIRIISHFGKSKAVTTVKKQKKRSVVARGPEGGEKG